MHFSITILTIGKKSGTLSQEIERYQALIRPFASMTVSYLKSPASHSFAKSELLEAEGKAILAKMPERSYRIALSEEGRCPLGSKDFSTWLVARGMRGSLSFIIGGAYGLSPAVKKSCHEILSLSPLTYPHTLSLVVLLEQIYRAFTIFKGHPYHK
ncbi:MAG TPA: 23S rRNA (pseudouridine(1915)-N(3))-methyltransferase RlmH [Chitinivibrionales bacterium]|nr:23S rRNA (pseudouridine(1915)-N(3))-methyltransferase RlmH [Chitinivibrionales bacterium]